MASDQDLINQATYHLLENGNADATGSFVTTMYTPAQLIAALNDRQRRFLKDTACVLKCAAWAGRAGQARYTLVDGFPTDWIETRRLGWATVTSSPPIAPTVVLTKQSWVWSTGALTVTAASSGPVATLTKQLWSWIAAPRNPTPLVFAGAQNLIQNPSFWNNDAFKFNTTNWTIVSGTPDNIFFNDGTHTFVDDPANSAVGTGTIGTSVTMQQTVTTVNAHVYTYSFWVVGFGGTGTTITVFFNGATKYTVTDLFTSSLWVQHTFSVTGTGSDVVKFTVSDTTGSNSVAIDEFALTP